MANKVRKRTVTADDGSAVTYVTVTDNGQPVDDPRNGVTVTSVYGDETFVPMSAVAVSNTRDWYQAA